MTEAISEHELIEIDPALGPVIQRLRGAAGLSLEELAASSGIDNIALAALEQGGTETRWGTVRAIARVLGTPFLDLVAEASVNLPDDEPT